MGITISVNGQRQTDRQTAKLNCEISSEWETKPRATPQKISLLLMGPKRTPGLKPCRVYEDNDDLNLFLKRDYFKWISCKHRRLLNSGRWRTKESWRTGLHSMRGGNRRVRLWFLHKSAFPIVVQVIFFKPSIYRLHRSRLPNGLTVEIISFF
jgi:hypothetical protein